MEHEIVPARIHLDLDENEFRQIFRALNYYAKEIKPHERSSLSQLLSDFNRVGLQKYHG